MSAKAEKVRNVRIIDAAPSIGKIQGRRVPVIRGVIMPEFFDIFVIPEYQRDAMLGEKHEDLFDVLALDGIGVPDDILLCMGDATFQPVGNGELILPATSLTVLDGHQRVFASRARVKQKLATDPLGVKIFIGATLAEEIETFNQVNLYHTEVSSDVHLRNSGKNAATEALRKLSESEGFPPIKWSQRGATADTIKAHTLFGVAAMLHGYGRDGGIPDLHAKLQKSVDRVGTALFTQNVDTFFRYLRENFAKTGLQPFVYRADFMRGLAMLLAHYTRFWDPKQPERLSVNAPDLRKLAGTPKKEMERAIETKTAVSSVFNVLMNRYKKPGLLVLRELDI